MDNNYKRYYSILKNIARGYGKEYEDDLKQDLYLYLEKLLQDKNTKKADKPYAYIKTALINKAKHLFACEKHIRDKTVSLDSTNVIDVPILDLIADMKGYEEDLILEEVKIYFYNNIKEIMKESLTKKEEDVFMLVFFEEKPQKEIKDKQNVSQQTISETYRRACRKLKDVFQKIYDDWPD